MKATFKIRAFGHELSVGRRLVEQAGGCRDGRGFLVTAVPTFEELLWRENREILAVKQISQKQEPDC